MGTKHTGTASEIRALDAYIKLMRAADSVTARVTRALAPHKLTVSQFGILEALMHLGELHQNELGQKLLKSSGNITLVVDNLEKRGLITRERSTDDRRFVWVRLTREGDAYIRKVFPEIVTAITQAMVVLSPFEQEKMAEFLKQVGQNSAETFKG
ncbi:MAG: MarR family transcriptional regulator [Calditrichaeota bacterium]|nr:MarR family transcriptional regulator [Calditrichota bacterium]MCB9367220.1 MarR family transcriptional regulator [Calditrichota bacterium]MCB9391792.1 MarR family transcriptional regulator [Calditrichota bacterium]